MYQSIRDAYKKTPPVPLFELRSQPAFTNPNNLRQVSILLRVYESEPSAYPNMCIMHYAGEKRIPDNVPQQHITKLQNKQISEAIEAYRRLPHVGQRSTLMDSDTSTFEIDMNMFTQRGFDELDHAAHQCETGTTAERPQTRP